MPKLSGFMQGLNLNLGKERERKASLIAGLALNPSLLSRAVLAGRICAHGERRRPAVGGTSQRGGFVQDSVCGDFKSPNPYNLALQGAGGMQLPGEELLDGTLHPKTLGCCLGSATTLWSPCEGGSSSQPGAGQEHPRAPLVPGSQQGSPADAC